MASLTALLRNIFRHRAMIVALAFRDMESRYAGTMGGIIWSFAHPLAVVVIFYFVFAVGFRAQGPADTPFVLWFVCGLVAWFFFNETLVAITSSISRNAHLVKKTVFPTEILPFVHLFSGLLPHAIFLLILIGLLVFFKIPFLAERLGVTYFIICSCALLLGLGWILAALQVFYRDIAHGLTITLNLWFWITPIVWLPDIMPAKYHALLFYNPVFYLVEGYRGILIYPTVTWPSISATMYFWLITCAFLLAGSYTFRRLKPEFPDVI